MAKECFIIKVWDTTNLELVTELEVGRKGSFSLVYQGGDVKEQSVIGSVVEFTMLDPNNEDGHFFDLYTGNESKFRVELINIKTIDEVATEFIVWKGFLLPEQYEEPYTNNNLFVRFIASCGLGRLKGKFLPDQYYKGDHSVMAYLCACLKETSNLSDLYFSPAILNNNGDRYDSISIESDTFKSEEGQRFDAYSILKQLLDDMQCCVYHEWGNWFIEGYNKRAVKKKTFEKYDIDAVYQESILITRKPVDVSDRLVGRPRVGTVSPIKRAVASHPVKEIEIPTSVFKEESDGWVVTGQSFVRYKPRNLFYNNWDGLGWISIDTATNNLVLFNFADFDPTDYVYLRNRIFVTSGQKFQFTSKLSLQRITITNGNIIPDEDLFNIGAYQGLIRIDIVVLDGNENILQEVKFTQDFDEERKSININEFLITENGYLDVRLYRPIGNNFSSANPDPNSPQYEIRSITIDDVNLKHINYEETATYENEVNDDFSLVKDIDLVIADDITSDINRFKLENDKVQDQFLYNEDLDILSTFVFENVHYVVLDPFDIFSVKDFPDFVFLDIGGNGSGFIKIENPEVTYNFRNGDLNVFSYDPNQVWANILTSDKIRVAVTGYTYPDGDRRQNQKWVDAVTGINPSRYGQVVTGIYRRLYKEPHITLDCTVNGIYLFSSMLLFGYRGPKEMYPLKLAIDLTNGKTSGKYVQAYYGDEELEIAPISVDAGEDIFVPISQNIINLTAITSSPNSFITDVQWTVVSGSAVFQYPNQLTTAVFSGYSRDFTVRVTVTDNYGQTASDDVRIVRQESYAISLADNQDVLIEQSAQVDWRAKSPELVISPDLVDDIIIIRIDLGLIMTTINTGRCEGSFAIHKNGTRLIRRLFSKPPTNSTISDTTRINDSYDVTYLPGDFLEISMSTEVRTQPIVNDYARMLMSVGLAAFQFQNNSGTVTPEFLVTTLESLKSN